MNTAYKGIDYGLGQTNVDRQTGIRYGVISIHEVTQAWCDSSEPHYGEPHCPECGGELDKDTYSEHETCPHCNAEFDAEYCYPENPLSYFYDKEGYSAECGESGDIFITKSPYFTFAQYCSPCAPGACYLMNWLDGDENCDTNKAYCFGHNWFDGGKAPYPVYSVETGELVQPETT